MDVVSSCLLRTGSIVWQPRPGAWALTVVCKATYLLAPNESPLAEDQDEPNEADGFWNDDATRSLSVASDLAPFKRRADVLLVGHAFAPGKQPVRSLMARLVVGGVDKSVAVFGDRAWMHSGELQEAAPFARMPLRWERAAGGPRTANPVGVRMGGEAVSDRQGFIVVPNLQPAGAYLATPADRFDPAGFAPIAPRWPGRMEKLHRHAAGWNPSRWSEQPLPEDIDAAFFNLAPPDQQVSVIRNDERILMENLHQEHPRLATTLAWVEPRAVVERAEGTSGVQLRCDTLWIDTDRGRCALLWRGQVMLANPREAGRVVVTAGFGRADVDTTATAIFTERLSEKVVLPFAIKSVHPNVNVDAENAATDTLQADLCLVRHPFPFRSGESQLADPAEATPLHDPRDGTGTMLTSSSLRTVPLPFLPVQQLPDGHALLAQPLEMVSPFERQSAVESIPREDGLARNFDGNSPVPPLMIGPLTKSVVVVTVISAAPSNSAALLSSSHAPSPEPQKLPLDAFPIERCAGIAASIARRRAEEAQIIQGNELDRMTWAQLMNYWNEAIRAETTKGKTVLLEQYDTAYVGRIENERGVIQVDEYARLAVARERGDLDSVLTEMTLPRGALLRIERVWLRKIAGDVGFAQIVGAAVEAAREK